MDDAPLQCAWCLRIYNAAAVLDPPLPELSREASHGLCPRCFATLLDQQSGALARSGNLLGAVRFQRQRLRVIRSLSYRFRSNAIRASLGLQSQSRDLLARSRQTLEACRRTALSPRNRPSPDELL